MISLGHSFFSLQKRRQGEKNLKVPSFTHLLRLITHNVKVCYRIGRLHPSLSCLVNLPTLKTYILVTLYEKPMDVSIKIILPVLDNITIVIFCFGGTKVFVPTKLLVVMYQVLDICLLFCVSINGDLFRVTLVNNSTFTS